MTIRALHVLDCVWRALLRVMGSIAYISKAHIKIISAKKKKINKPFFPFIVLI